MKPMKRGFGKIIFLLLATVGIMPIPAESAPRAKISLEFKTQAVVRQEAIYLADIATIKGTPRSGVDRISQLKIKTAPPVGEILVLSREEVAWKIHQANFAAVVSINDIPEQIEVLREGRWVEKEEILDMLETHLRNRIPDRNREIQIRELQGGEGVIVPLGALSSEAIFPEQFHRGGPLSITLSLRVDGREVQKIRLQARVEIYGPVVTAKNQLKRSQEIGEKDVEIVRKNLSLLPADVLTDSKDVQGKRITLTVNSQEVLRASMVEIPPLIKKGDRVILIVENEYFKITTFGEAKEDGRKGERVKLMNISSQKEVSGRVLNAQTVHVDF
jgi:flagella basal body P-ring formation protein FlgA